MVVALRIIAVCLISLLIAPPVRAAEVNKGLSISPLRKNTTIESGATKPDTFTVANLTDKPMVVSFHVKQFSVTNYAYDYQFHEPENDWVKLDLEAVELKPGERKKIQYSITAPPRTAPGGHYYTLFASTKLMGGGLPGTVQAATLLYLTVNGELIRSSVLQNDSIPFLVTGNEVPYKFDVKDTGNVHFSAYFYGQLQGLLGKQPEVGTGRLVMPGVVRTVQGSIPSPLLPGIYRATYGYKVDFADIIITKSTFIVYIPPWSVIATVLLGLVGLWRAQQRKLTKPAKPSKKSTG